MEVSQYVISKVQNTAEIHLSAAVLLSFCVENNTHNSWLTHTLAISFYMVDYGIYKDNGTC